MTPWSAAILAGGQSRRFGAIKFLSKVGGETLLRRVARAVLPDSGDLMVIAGQDEDPGIEQAVLSELNGMGPRIVMDTPGPRTPAAGIEAALLSARFDRVVVVAADMPFLSRDLLMLLVQRSEGNAAAVPSYRGFHEPTCAVYTRSFLPSISAYRKDPQGPISRCYDAPSLSVSRIGDDELSRFGAVDVLFFNVNTREDLARAQDLLSLRVPGTVERGASG